MLFRYGLRDCSPWNLMHVVTSAHPMAAFGLNGQLAVWLFHPVEPPVLHDIPTAMRFPQGDGSRRRRLGFWFSADGLSQRSRQEVQCGVAMGLAASNQLQISVSYTSEFMP
jgi:hypothetical protein